MSEEAVAHLHGCAASHVATLYCEIYEKAAQHMNQHMKLIADRTLCTRFESPEPMSLLGAPECLKSAFDVVQLLVLA